MQEEMHHCFLSNINPDAILDVSIHAPVWGATLLAAPMVGGVVTSTILELIIYPAIYMLWRGRQFRTKAAEPVQAE